MNPGGYYNLAPGVVTPVRGIRKEETLASWRTDNMVADPDSYSMYGQLQDMEKLFSGSLLYVFQYQELILLLVLFFLPRLYTGCTANLATPLFPMSQNPEMT